MLNAIAECNAGKKVVLLLDEYDKAREETDTFLYQFLQSGKISTTQFQNSSIDKKFRKNLQVILCKNDNREFLSDPLTRRVYFVRLSEMEPKTLYKVASKKFPNNPEVVSFITLIYYEMFKNKDKFKRVPAYSEVERAIKDVIYFRKEKADNRIIYQAILDHIVKNPDEYELFQKIMKASQREELMKFALALGEIKEKTTLDDIITSMYNTSLADAQDKVNRATNAQNQYEERLKILDQQIKDSSNIVKVNEGTGRNFKGVLKGNNTVLQTLENNKELFQVAENANLVSSNSYQDIKSVFISEKNVNRGQSFIDSDEKWVELGNLRCDVGFNDEIFTKSLLDNLRKSDKILAYENGFVLNMDDDTKIAIARIDVKNDRTILFFSNTAAVPAEGFKYFANVISMAKEASKNKKIKDLEFNCLVAGAKISKYDEWWSPVPNYEGIEQLAFASDETVNPQLIEAITKIGRNINPKQFEIAKSFDASFTKGKKEIEKER